MTTEPITEPEGACPLCSAFFDRTNTVLLPYAIPPLTLDCVLYMGRDGYFNDGSWLPAGTELRQWAHPECAEQLIPRLEEYVALAKTAPLAKSGDCRDEVLPKVRSVLRKLKAERTQKDPVLVARARLAIASRNGQPTAALKQDLNYANLYRAIGKALGDAGLMDAQRSALTELLNS